MAVAVQQRQRDQEKDPLDTILKGLHIANSVYGLKDAGLKADQLRAQTERQNALADKQMAQLERQEKGIITAGELLGKAGTYQASTKDDPTAIPFRVQGENGIYEIHLKPPKHQDTEMAQLRKDQMIERQNMAKERAIERSTSVQEKKQAALDNKVEKLSGKLQGASAINSAISGIESKLKMNLDDYDGSPVDLPGVSVPGLGRVTAHSKDARILESTIAKIFNTELKDRSGAAVTSNELERLKIEFGSGKFNTEEEMIGALRDYKLAFRDMVSNLEAGYSQDALSTLKERGGFTSSSISRGKGLSIPDQFKGRSFNPFNQANAGQENFGDTQNKAQQLLIQRQGIKAGLPRK